MTLVVVGIERPNAGQRAHVGAMRDGNCAGLNVLGIPCTRNGNTLVDGKWYCRTHVPSTATIRGVRSSEQAHYRKTCEQCGHAFWGTHRTSRFCTHECYATSRLTVNRKAKTRRRRFYPCPLTLTDKGVFERRVEAARLAQVDVAWATQLRVELGALRPSHDAEIAALADEQERDSRRCHFGGVWAPSLDAPRYRGDVEAGERHDVIPDPNSADPYLYVEGTESMDALVEIVGTDDLDKIARMNQDTLGWLREKLRLAGIVPHGVQQAERQRQGRATTPETHTGKNSPRGRWASDGFDDGMNTWRGKRANRYRLRDEIDNRRHAAFDRAGRVGG